jgi:hypothetical protein
MTTKDTLALALEALEAAEFVYTVGLLSPPEAVKAVKTKRDAAITAIKQAQQAQEPVEPLFFYRPTCNGEMYEGPWHTNSTQVRMFPQEKRHELVPLHPHPAPKQAEPTGYKLVPVEPDESWMYRVIHHRHPDLDVGSKAWLDCAREVFHWHSAMLAAAPTPPEAK